MTRADAHVDGTPQEITIYYLKPNRAGHEYFGTTHAEGGNTTKLEHLNGEPIILPNLLMNEYFTIQNLRNAFERDEYPAGVSRSAPTSTLTMTVATANTTEPAVPFPDLETDPTLSTAVGDLWDGSVGPSQVDGTQSIAASEEHQIQAFAKLEFDDGEFYMNTYAVELGRDIRAARLASEQDFHLRDGRVRKRSASSGGGSIKSVRSRREQNRNFANSVVSESGGVIGVDPPVSDLEKRSSTAKAKSASSSSQQLSRKSSIHLTKTDYNALALESLQEYASLSNDVNTTNPLPSPELTPLIPIHPPAVVNGVSLGHKSISRKHIRIAFNFERHLFEVAIQGRNGAFVDEEWYAPGEVQPLVSGSIIQIGGVGIRFVLPDVPPGETGAEIAENSDPLSGGKLSFNMADSDEGEDHENAEASARKINGQAVPESEPPKPKRRGPGRPPKNGIISKREQALLARQAREDAKEAEDNGYKTLPGRGKGKTAKPLEARTDNLQPSGKRKYTKRKRAGADLEQQIRESTEQTDSVTPDHAATAKTAKEKSKPIKPPRSPSPVFDEATLTPEQLAKPQSSYVVLIHEALSNSKTGQMSLPQIYRAIERRYPFFKLRVQTQGWQSSVRHNLSQHPAFKKIERDGKGWMWGLVPEVSIEKEKKRRPTPPPQPQTPQQYYQHPPTYPQATYSYPGVAAPTNGQVPSYPYGIPPRYAYAAGSGPGGYPFSFVKTPSEGTYKSPYESSAPTASATTVQPDISTQAINGHNPVPTSQPDYAPGHLVAEAAKVLNRHSMEEARSQDTSFLSPQSEDVIAAVNKFKTTLVASMDDKDRAEKLVSCAIEKRISKFAGESEDPEENAIMIALSNIITTIEKRHNKSLPQTGSEIPGKVGKPQDTVVAEAQGTTVVEMAADIARKLPLMHKEEEEEDDNQSSAEQETEAKIDTKEPSPSPPPVGKEKENEREKEKAVDTNGDMRGMGNGIGVSTRRSQRKRALESTEHDDSEGEGMTMTARTTKRIAA